MLDGKIIKMDKEKIVVITFCLLVLVWGGATAYKFIEKPKVVEKVKIEKVNDTYYNNVKVNGDCALVDPPCWEFDFKQNLDRRSILRLK